ncbi:CLUMA_CG014226, isoform A, partial [Clunio marinus]
TDDCIKVTQQHFHFLSSFLLIADNYRSIASDLCSLAKEQGSRDNISVIVVYLKDPQLIATQSWPSTFQEQSKNMENFNIYEHQEQPVANPVTMDALGNTNQDIYNNPFGDFNNQFISDVAMGKASEISDLVTQQQPVCNITETMTNNLNNINNNKFNNGHDEMEKNFVVDDGLNFDQPSSQQPQEAANILVLNDDNNNSNNDNFSGPETDVDAIDDDVPLNASLGAVGGAKEKIQMEFKETEDFTDQAAENVNFGVDNSAAIYGTLENKIFEELSLHNPDMIEGNNPFESIDDSNVLKEAAKFASAPVMEEFIDNKTFEQEIHDMSDFVEKAQKFGMEEEFNKEIIGAVDELKSATDDEVAMQQQPQIDLGFIESTQQQQQQQAIGESGGEESEDEWNYIEGDKKSSDNNLAAVKENSEKVESTLTEERQETEGEQLGKFIEHEQQFNSSIKDCEAVKEIAEEHFKEEIENKLPLTIDTEESDEMSQLNPDAKEFIPVSPSRELFNNMSLNSPPLNGQMNPIINNLVNEDIVVSQSPRKGEFQPMEDVIIPSEQDFDTECSSRPHEFDSSSPIENRDVPQIMNLKESQQRDDKLEHEYKDEAFFEEEKRQSSEDYKVLEKSFSDYSNGFQNVIDDPMNRSFYEGREGDVLLATAGDVLNTLQPIPTFEDEQPEADHQNFTTESDKPEADHLECQITSESILSFTQETKDDQFEAEQFVEEIKSASEVADKYNDVGLSPQLPEVTFNTVQTTVDEPIKAEMELIEQIQETVPAAKAPSSTTASTKAPITKPAPTKPLATTKKATAPLSAAPKPAPKSTVSSASTLRSKPSTTSAAAPKRPMSSTTAKPSTDSAAAKPTPAARATTLTKKPATSVAATKPLSRPTSAAVPSKTKLTNGSSTERKPLSFSASTTRAPAKPPTSLATKPNGTSMTTAARSPTKPLSSTRLSTSNVEKSSTSPIKEKLLNRSIGSATSTRSPRPTTSATTMKTVVKDVKSPTGTASKTTPSSLSAVGVKKPLSAVKKASTTTTTTTTVKKVPSKTTAVKKTTTTTTTVVQKKKIVNGDIVSEETSTTTTSGEPQLMIEEIIKDGFASELNGHTNGTAENGTAADNVQMLIDSTAD